MFPQKTPRAQNEPNSHREPCNVEPQPPQSSVELKPPQASVEPQPPQASAEPQPPQAIVGPEPSQANVEPEPSQASVGPEPSQASVGPELSQASVGPEPSQASVRPESCQTSVGPKPSQASVEPEPSQASVGPEPSQASVGPEPSQASVGPEPSRASVWPEPSQASVRPESCQTSVGPKPSQASVEPEPSQASVGPEPSQASVGPEPSQASVGPEPSRASVWPEPSQASVRPESCQTSVGPKPSQASVEPEPSQASVGPEPSQASVGPDPSQTCVEPCQTIVGEQSKIHVEPRQTRVAEQCQGSMNPGPYQNSVEPEPCQTRVKPVPSQKKLKKQERVRSPTKTSSRRCKDMELEIGRDVFAEPGKIGEGLQAEVSLGKLAGSRKLCAIKTFKTFDVNMFRESQILTKLSSSKYVPRYYGTIKDPKNPKLCAMAMEFVGDLVNMKSETLAKVLNDDADALETMEWIDVALTLCKGLADIHGAGFLHADLKIDNVMLHRESDKWQSKIIDFGFSYPILAEPKPYNLTPEEKEYYSKNCMHVAPEIIDGSSGHTIKSDIYSLGDTLAVLGAETGIRPIYNWGQQCMETDPVDRPELKWVISMIEKLKKSWTE